jgi:hypothetical protein
LSILLLLAAEVAEQMEIPWVVLAAVLVAYLLVMRELQLALLIL